MAYEGTVAVAPTGYANSTGGEACILDTLVLYDVVSSASDCDEGAVSVG